MYEVTVRLLSALTFFDRPYSYLSEEKLECGAIAALPFGNSDRHQYSVVISCKEAGETAGLKKILFTLPEPYRLTPLQVDSARFISERFFSSFGDAARLMLPSGLDVDTAEYVKPTELFLESAFSKNAEIYSVLTSKFEKNGRAYIGDGIDKKSLLPFIKKSLLSLHSEAVCHINEKSERYARVILTDPEKVDLALKGTKQKEKYKTALNHISSQGEMSAREIMDIYSMDSSALALLERRGLIEIFSKKVHRSLYDIGEIKKANDTIELSDEQKSAFDTLSRMLSSPTGSAALLYGVTGSGKTSVILSLIDEAVSEGRGVIMLVPEIALTSQSAASLLSRYGDRVAIIHSGMSKGERHDSWQAIKEGRQTIVLGTRSALFAPIKNLGLLVIDEEQDDSYKSDITPKYHARDVARFMCAKSGALLLLSSATPDVESYYHAKTGRYTLVQLKRRYGEAILPDVIISDVSDDKVNSPDTLVGRELRERISETLSRGEQVILFVNRRGLKKLLICRSCQSTVTCPNCSVPMTLHEVSGNHRLVCHYCGYSTSPPTVCPNCQSGHMYYRGYGTQKLEEELKLSFPNAKIVRMDADSTREKLSHERLIEDFSSHKADILIGTQMVAKGHNFPDVTLVGAIMADLSLFSSDYRANEHTFSLMTQVVGRAGRGKKKGSAVIQTLNPYNEIIELCTTQDYDAFFEGEIAFRRAFLFPPFCTMGTFVISSDDESALTEGSGRLNGTFTRLLGGEFSDVKLMAYGPFEAVPYKLKNIYRHKLVVKFKNDKRTRELFLRVLNEFGQKDRVKCSFDSSPTFI